MLRTTFLPYGVHLLCRRGDELDLSALRRGTVMYSDFCELDMVEEVREQKISRIPWEMQCSYHSVGVS